MQDDTLPFTTQGKWISLIIWLALLAGLIFTSANAVALSLGANFPSYIGLLSGAAQPIGNYYASSVILAISELVLILVLIYQLFRAWRNFAHFSHDLISAYAKPHTGETGSEIFFDMLVFPSSKKTDDEQLDPDDATSTTVSEILRSIGYAWVIIIVSPPIIRLVDLLG